MPTGLRKTIVGALVAAAVFSPLGTGVAVARTTQITVVTETGCKEGGGSESYGKCIGGKYNGLPVAPS
jgi:hypothetical protein